jgi:hypothetical protein
MTTLLEAIEASSLSTMLRDSPNVFLYPTILAFHTLGLAFFVGISCAIALRVLTRIVTQLGGEEPRGGAVARLFDALVEGRTSSIGPLVARPGLGGWTFTKAPVRRAAPPSKA